MKKREISDSDTNEIQSEELKKKYQVFSEKCFQINFDVSFYFSVSIKFMLKVWPSRGSLASRLTDLDFL